MLTRPRAGSGAVRLVLLPGMDGTEIMFGPLLAALPSWIAAETVKYPEDGPNSYEELQPLVDAAVGRGPECMVLGWSFSGPLALRTALRHPDRVYAVILVGSFLTPPLPWLRYVRPLVRTPAFALFRVFRRLPLWLTKSRRDPLRRAKAMLWTRVPAASLAARARAILRLDATADLKRCPCPIHYVAGKADRVVPPHNLQAIRRLRPDTTVTTIQGRHFALFTSAREGADAIAACAGRASGATADTRWGPARREPAGP